MWELHSDVGSVTPATGDEKSAAIARLLTTRDPAEIEHLADEFARWVGCGCWTGSSRGQLIEALILCLTGESIRNDADAEDAICGALEEIGVMAKVGNLVFELVPDAALPASDLAAVRRYGGWLPRKYAASRPAADGRDVHNSRESTPGG
jgi:hypothetical protein